MIDVTGSQSQVPSVPLTFEMTMKTLSQPLPLDLSNQTLTRRLLPHYLSTFTKPIISGPRNELMS